MVFNIRTFFLLHLLSSLYHNILHILQFLLLSNKWNHNLWNYIVTFLLLHLDSSLHNSSRLHLSNLRICHSQTTASVTHHRVKLMKLITFCLDIFWCQSHICCKCLNVLHICRNKLMKRRVQITHGHRSSLQCLIHSLKVTLLERNQLVQCRLSRLNSIRQNHLANLWNTVRLKEHMLCTAKTNSLSAKLNSIFCICRSIRIRPNFQCSKLICPSHNSAEVS